MTESRGRAEISRSGSGYSFIFTRPWTPILFELPKLWPSFGRFVKPSVNEIMSGVRQQPDTRVYKFGGTSVATAERIERVVDLIAREPASLRRIVVVSALGGVTDLLLAAIADALARTKRYLDTLHALRERHQEVIRKTARPSEHDALEKQMEADLGELTELLDGVYLVRECTARTRDAIMGLGERLSAPLVAAAFRAQGHDAHAVDARRLIRTDAVFGEANVQFDVTDVLIQDHFAAVPAHQIAVVTGFIASTEQNVSTTLGRSGSDYTATILGAALHAAQVVIWTDVDGVLSADPRLVPEAFTLSALHYREAAEMAYFGAKVLHPRTMRPVQLKNIALYIKNTLNPESEGTLISSAQTDTEGNVKAVTSIRNVALVILEGTGMAGVPGISARAFGALAHEQINVLMISQASSEQSICIVVREREGQRAVEALRAAFPLELVRGDISAIEAEHDCAIISIVGDYMRRRPGLAGRMFATLGRAGVNVKAIAEGSAETNISAVVQDDDAQYALRALHEAFALGRDRAHLFLFGAGSIGSTVLGMLAKQAPILREQLNVNLQLMGVANSRQIVWDAEGIPFDQALHRLEENGQPADLDAVIAHLRASKLERLIVVDATASSAIAERIPGLLEHNIAVITPNKVANTLRMDFYDRIARAVRLHQVPFLYETTVGAGLPVIATLRDLLRSGDQVQRIEGVLSGTLSYVFNQLAAGVAFSEAVRTAQQNGFTEPDPREDLRGTDVARKLLILAREMGLRLELEDVSVESLVPESLQDLPVDQFLAGLSGEDAQWQKRLREAQERKERLVYVGRIENGKARVSLESVAVHSAYGNLRSRDNIVLFTTAQYKETPLVIQGPGAGPEVTAAGVLADIVTAAELVR